MAPMITPPEPLPRPEPRSKRPVDLWIELLGAARCAQPWTPQSKRPIDLWIELLGGPASPSAPWRLTKLLHAAEQLVAQLEWYGYEVGTSILAQIIAGRALIKLIVDGETIEFGA